MFPRIKLRVLVIQKKIIYKSNEIIGLINKQVTGISYLKVYSHIIPIPHTSRLFAVFLQSLYYVKIFVLSRLHLCKVTNPSKRTVSDVLKAEVYR